MSPATITQPISLNHLGHVYYKHKDLDRAHQFLLDFGFTEEKRVGDKIYYRGYGTEPFVYCAEKGDEDEFAGAGFIVDSFEELERASSTLPKATAIYDLVDAPGGGKGVTFWDPVDGYPMHLVFGQTHVLQNMEFEELAFNFPMDKHRTAGQFQRLKQEPAAVHKLGHYGMCVTDYAKSYEFYTTHFNFKASNIVYDDDGRDVSCFLHLERGSELVDHHTFFFFEGPKCHVHHSSFEVHDFDRQVLGHDWLRDKKYSNCWGVGRHVMGSQIFDYWFDTSGFIVEHYVDGDLVNCDIPTQREKAGPGTLYVWGPDVPATFLT